MLEEHIFTFSGEACNTGCIFCKSTFRPSSQRELILSRDDKPAPHYDDHHLKTHVGVDVDLRRGLACKSDELTRVEFPHNLRISISRWSIFDLAPIFLSGSDQSLTNSDQSLINSWLFCDQSLSINSWSISDWPLIAHILLISFYWFLINILSISEQYIINCWSIFPLRSHLLLVSLPVF